MIELKKFLVGKIYIFFMVKVFLSIFAVNL